MHLFIFSILVLVFFKFSHNYKKFNVSKIELKKLNNKYHIRDDIINYNRFKYVYNIKNHPIHDITKEILHFLKKKVSFYLVYNKCPLYDNNLCFNEILIKNTNETTSKKNNFYFSDSFLYIPQATSLFPYIYQLLNKKTFFQTENTDINEETNICDNVYHKIDEKQNVDALYKRIKSEKSNNKNTKLPSRGNTNSNTNNININSCKTNGGNDNDKINDDIYKNKISSNINSDHIKIIDYNLSNFDSKNFCIISSIFRKDNIDKLHFPFFNQMDIYIKIKNELINKKKQLIYFLCELLSSLFEKKYKWRIREDSFDFTKDSLQAEVFYNNKWVEILGSGILKKKIIFKKNKKYDIYDYLAIGLGIDRIAMIKFGINRIRDLYLYISNTENTSSKSVTKDNTNHKPKNDVIKNDVIKNDVIKNDVIKNDVIKNDVMKNDIINSDKKNDIINNNKLNKNYNYNLKSKLDEMKNSDMFKKENILLESPKKEGIKLGDELLYAMKEPKNENEILHFINLYNIKDEERDLSFYANSEWSNEEFIKNVLDFKNIKNINFLKNIYLFDTFFNKKWNKTSYSYKFIYVATINIKEQYIFKNYVKELHEEIIEKILNTYDITIR